MQSGATLTACSNTGNNVVADVAYDLWLAPSAGANNVYEIMIWLGSIGGAGPISEVGAPIDTPTILGTQWKLYKGPNGGTTVFSFVAASNIQSFEGDLKKFFDYLSSSQGVSQDMTLTSLGAGTEPFLGTVIASPLCMEDPNTASRLQCGLQDLVVQDVRQLGSDMSSTCLQMSGALLFLEPS
jgi:hypothetical protein